MNTGKWIGGNQDLIFLKDLLATGVIPGKRASCCNQSRYINSEFDKIVEESFITADREKAKVLYEEAPIDCQQRFASAAALGMRQI